MSNAHARLIAAALALVAGAILCTTPGKDMGGLIMAVAGGALAVEYVQTIVPRSPPAPRK